MGFSIKLVNGRAENLSRALTYIRRSWRVFPCEVRGKRPLGRLAPHGLKDATDDSARVERWWNQEPEANIGIATGEASGFFAVDIDPRHGGEDGWRSVTVFRPEFQTAWVQTPSGGRHLYFQMPAGLQIRNRVGLLPGVDVRANDGYVIGPGSTTSFGHYSWGASSAIAVPPTWLLDLLLTAAPRSVTVSANQAIPEGTRNATLVSLAGTMRWRGMTPQAIEAALLAENSGRCVPPLPASEVSGIAASVARYPACTVAAYSPRGATNACSAGLALTSLADLLAEPVTAQRWLVEERIPVAGLALLAGKPKTGKSTLARHLALCVARGEPFLGWTTLPGAVWYLALEEKRSEFARHFAQMGASVESVWVLADRAPDDAVAMLRERAQREHPALIIVDPLQRLIRARDLNDYAQVTSVLDPLLHLARQTDAAVLLVHHMVKGDRSSADGVLGSTALHGSVDSTLLLKRTDRYRVLCSEQRYGQDLEETVLTLTDGRLSVGGLRIDADQSVIEAAILQVAAGTEKLLEEELLSEVEGRTGLKRAGLRALVQRGAMDRVGGGRRGDPYRYSRSVVPDYYREQENEKRPSLK